MVKLQALSVQDRTSLVLRVPVPSVGEDVRDLLHTTLDEAELTAAVHAVEAVVEEYLRKAHTAAGPAHPEDRADASRRAVRAAMEQGVPVVVLQRSLWQAHLRLLDKLLGTEVSGGDVRTVLQSSAAVTQGLASFTARCCEEVAAVYAGAEQSVTAVVRDGQDRRQMLVRALSDCSLDSDEAEQVLGLNLSDHHWAAALWSVPGADLEVEDLVRFALAISRAVGGSRPLVAVNSASEVWMWTRWARPPQREAIAAACSRLVVPEGLRAGTGPVGTGLAGFRRSLLGARAVQRTAGQVTDSWWCDYEEVSPVTLLTSDKEQARWFVEEVLGELGRDEPWYAILRETLRLYLAHGRSRQQVATAMYINRNTVAYRVQKASQLLGRPIEEDAFGVRLALEITRASHSPSGDRQT